MSPAFVLSCRGSEFCSFRANDSSDIAKLCSVLVNVCYIRANDSSLGANDLSEGAKFCDE